jgi:hypothetical protein
MFRLCLFCNPWVGLLKRLPKLRRAGEWSWAGDGIRCRLWPVHLELNTWIGTLVCSWEADGCRAGVASSGNVDLGTFHVELGSGIIGGCMKSDELGSEEVPECSS